MNNKFGVISFKEKKYIYKEDKTNKLTLKKLSDVNQLNENIIWFSDLSKEELWRTGYLKNLNIKHSHYLNTSFEHIKNNILDKESKVSYLIKMLYIFEKIMQLSMKMTNLDLNASELSIAIKPTNEVVITNYLSDCLLKTYQDEIQCLTELELIEYKKNGYKEIQIKKNGLLYLEEIKDKIIIPDTHYVIYTLEDFKRDIGKLNISHNDFINQKFNGKVFLLNINDKKIKPKYESQIEILDNNTHTFTLNKRVERNWITSIEFDYMKNFYDFEICGAIIFNKELDKNEFISKYNIMDIKTDELSYFSIVITIMMENYLISWQEKDFKTQKVTLLNSFISALEKKELLIMSLLIFNNGYKVVSYGRNKIIILINNETNLDNLNKIIDRFGYFIF